MDKLSTSALAKELNFATGQLFKILSDFSWINNIDDTWVLTAKGEFEGGEYVHSKRYGRYIVWPKRVAEHPLIKGMQERRTISSTQLAKRFNLTAREVNRSLAEMAWISHSIQGWELLAEGERLGGIQLENQNSGNFYVVWPESILENPRLEGQLNWLTRQREKAAISTDDLFSAAAKLESLDGHQHQSFAHLKICHWLYLAGLTHAVKRLIPTSKNCYADFYVPAAQLYIDFWGDSLTAKEITLQLEKRTLYKTLQYDFLELDKDDIPILDDLLTRELRKRGVRVF